MISASETLLTLEQLRQKVPGLKGRPLGAETVRQWVKQGRRGILLESVRIGGRIYTSVQALDRFIAAQNPGQKAAGGRPKKIESVRERALRDCGA